MKLVLRCTSLAGVRLHFIALAPVFSFTTCMHAAAQCSMYVYERMNMVGVVAAAVVVMVATAD